MITAAEIAKNLHIEPYRVRYILDKFREAGQIKYKKVGQTYLYQDSAQAKVHAEMGKKV